MTTAVHTYQPRGGCAELFDRRDPEVLVSGPAGTGKSRACLEKVHAMAMSNPGMRGLIVRKTQVSLTSTALVTWKRDVIPETEQAGAVEYYGGSRDTPAQYRYSNGSSVEVGGMDKATKIMSSEYDVVYVQEATELTENDWESITTRLRSDVVSFQQIIGDCNPDAPTHWLKKRCDRGDTVLIGSRHEDNPTLFGDDGQMTDKGAAYMARLERLTGSRYERLRLGNWTGTEGAIFKEYDAAVHLTDPTPIPPEWNRYWSIDFGYVNPFVCQHYAEAPDGELIMYREFYGTHQLVSVWAETVLGTVTDTMCPLCRIRDLDGRPVVVTDLGGCRKCDDSGEVEPYWTEPRPVAIVCDHDAEGRATFSSIVGQSTVAAPKQVLAGIEAMQTRLRDKRLLFQRDVLHAVDETLRESTRPVRTVEEFGGYVWSDKTAKEQPIKEHDHGLDACRYVCAYRDLGHRPGVRFI